MASLVPKILNNVFFLCYPKSRLALLFVLKQIIMKKIPSENKNIISTIVYYLFYTVNIITYTNPFNCWRVTWCGVTNSGILDDVTSLWSVSVRQTVPTRDRARGPLAGTLGLPFCFINCLYSFWKLIEHYENFVYAMQQKGDIWHSFFYINITLKKNKRKQTFHHLSNPF